MELTQETRQKELHDAHVKLKRTSSHDSVFTFPWTVFQSFIEVFESQRELRCEPCGGEHTGSCAEGRHQDGLDVLLVIPGRFYTFS